MKKLIAGLLSVTMAFGAAALPVVESGFPLFDTAVTASADSYGDFEYLVINGGTIEIINYTGSSTNVTIPSEINGKEVTSIGYAAFEYCTSLGSVTIPSSVKSIGGSAFNECTNLKSVKISEGVKEIGSSAFVYCSSLKSVTIPNSVTTIGTGAFSECTSLESITIPKSVTSIGGRAFSGTLWLDAQIKKNPIVVVNNMVIEGRTASGSVTIPDGVTKISDYAFSECEKISSVTIPNSVVSIGHAAFDKCTSLASVTIPSSVTEIGDWAFCGCTGLTSVTIPNSVTLISDAMFSNCTSLKSITIPDSVTKIGYYAFMDCTSLTSITMPNTVDYIDGMAFARCTSLKSVKISENVTTVGWDAFAGCTSLLSVTIPRSVTSISQCAFGYYFDSEEKLPLFKIKCYAGTSGEQYAKENGFDYELLDHTHSYTSKITKAATCTADGVKTYTCSCGDTYTETIAKTTHTYKTTVVAPTYAAQGYTLHKCSTCGDSYKDTYTAKKTVGTVKAKTTYSSTTNSVKINWNKVSGATGYKVYRYNPTTKKWTSVKTISGASTLTYKDSGLKSGTSYKYKIRAYVKSDGKTYWGKYSSTITTATKPATAKITKTSKGKTSVKLYWKKINCTGYKVQRYNASTKKWVTVKTVSSATTNYKISGLKKNTSYKFRVCAYKSDGNKNVSGAWSNITVKTAK